MSRLLAVSMLMLLVALSGAQAQARQDAPPGADARLFYSVSYVEVRPDGRVAAIAALTRYRQDTRRAGDSIAVELFEQDGRPGHIALIEAWRTQSAFDAHAAARRQLVAAIEPLRISAWDERPYKTLSRAPGSGRAGPHAVFVIAHVDVAPDPKVSAMLTTMAGASRREPGNLRFDVLLDTRRPNHFEVIEGWRSAGALDAHALVERTRAYRDALQPFLGSPLDERIFTAIE